MQNQWSIIGPGGGGAQYLPTIKPDDPKTVLVACDMTGNYLTRDGGEHWRQFGLKYRVRAFAFDPHQTSTIYTGATGLYRSTDCGETWGLVFPHPEAAVQDHYCGDHGDHHYLSNDNWPGGKVEAIAIHPHDSQRLYIGINEAEDNHSGTEVGHLTIFASGDYGQHWERLCLVKGNSFLKLFIVPQNQAADRLFVFTDAGLFESPLDRFELTKVHLPTGIGHLEDVSWGIHPETKQTIFYLASPPQRQGGRTLTGAYASDDLGRSWRELRTGLDDSQAPDQSRHFTRVTTCPTDARVVYLSAVEPHHGLQSSSTFYFGVFKSQDCGQTWQWSLKIGEQNPPNRRLGWVEIDYDTEWGGAPFNLAIAPSDPRVCYASDWGTAYKTTDGGQSWEQVYTQVHPDQTYTSRGLDVTNITGVEFDPHDPQHRFLTCTDIGLFHSHNRGASWKHSIQGVPLNWRLCCYSLVFDPAVPGRIWSAWANSHDLPRPKMFRGNGFATRTGGICRSEDSGASWQVSAQGFPSHSVTTCVILDPRSPVGQRTLYATVTGHGVYKSEDDGRTWRPRNRGIQGSLYSWQLRQQPDGTLYLLVLRALKKNQPFPGALYRSTDGAESWTPVALPPGVNFPNDLRWNPQDPRQLYLACWPQPIAGQEQNGGLLKSIDGGQTWFTVFDSSAHVYGIAVDPDHPATIFITTFRGEVLRSDDAGITWQRLSGFGFKWPQTPILDPEDPQSLYVTTFGSSVWHGPRSTSD